MGLMQDKDREAVREAFATLGRLFGVAYAEAFKSHSPLLVESPTVSLPGLHA